jgi:hypothetical protein
MQSEKLNEVRYRLGRDILRTKPKSQWTAEDFQNVKYFSAWACLLQFKAGNLDFSLTAQKE